MQELAKKLLAKREEEQKANPRSGGSNYLWYSPPGDTTEVKIRILPPPVEGLPGRTIRTHYNIPNTNPGEKPVYTQCLKTWDMDCPICDVVAEYATKTEKAVDTYGAAAKTYFNVLVLSDPSYSKRQDGKALDTKAVHLMGTTETMLYWLAEQFLSPEAGEIVLDPIKGHNLLLQREKDGGKFKRNFALRPTPIADTDAEIQNILDKRIDPDKIWKSPDDVYLNKTRECASMVRDALENLILLGGSVATKAPAEAPIPKTASNTTANTSVEAPKSEASTSAQAVSKPAANKPANSPDCYGVKDEYNESSSKCQVCVFEIQCAGALK